MKKVFTFIIVVSLVLCCSLTMAACGGGGGGGGGGGDSAPAADTSTGSAPAAGGDETIRITFVCPAVGMPVWQGARYGMEAAAADFGLEVFWTGADDHTVDKTVEAFEQAVAERPDAVITCPFAPAAFETAMAKAADAGVIVTCVIVDTTTEDQRAAYIGTDSWVCGTMMAETLHSQVGDDLKIGILMSNLDSENQVIQVNALKAFIEPFPNAEILDIRENLTDMTKTIEVLSAMLDSYPEMNAVMCTEGNGAAPIAQVLRERGLTDKICAISMDDTDQNLQVIREGGIFALAAQNFFKAGYLGTQYAMEAFMGQSVPSITDSGTTIITKANVDTYMDEM